ncbi:cell division protein ZapB [Alteromonadaceae bacterium 2753L.S.0a.02]|nr:cell division protein ZapB [Alteromonadaceae bacterium 2753L.S.0a.02]
MTDKLINEVEHKLDQLISLCSHLEQENANLRAELGDWKQERARLIEKNELARSRVEAMISRLKNLEV